MPAWSGSGEVPFSPADYCFAVFSHGGKGAGEISGISFVRALIPFTRAPPSWPNYFPTPHLPTPLHWVLRFQHIHLEEGTASLLLSSHQVGFNSLQLHGLQHTSPSSPSPSHRVWPGSCPSNWWCPPTISSSVTLFSLFLQSFPESGSFPMIQLFASGGLQHSSFQWDFRVCFR